MWLLGTAVGASLGLLVMAFEPLATSPVGLAVILVAFTFCVGLLGQTQASRQALFCVGLLGQTWACCMGLLGQAQASTGRHCCWQ